MRLSYIVPVYKVEKYIRQCVDSILAQTLEESEIILVDDCSPDNCPSVCDEYAERYPDKIKVIHKENGGLASARNAGMDIAQGEYIFFVDSDDFLSGDRVKELYAKAKELDADILHSTYKTVDEEGNEIYDSINSFTLEKIYTHEEMEYEICFSNKKSRVIFVWRNLYRREFIEKHHIRFVEKLKMIEDGPFDTLAFLKAERFVAVNIPVYRYRYRDDSLQRIKYKKDYDLYLAKQTELKIKYYTENCRTQRKEFYEDIAEHIIKNMLPLLLYNIYKNKVPDRFGILKRIGNSEMMKMCFENYDIKQFKSKSLDWLMTWCIKNRLYVFAHLICENILYKPK